MSMDARDQFPVDMVEQMLKFTPSPEERVRSLFTVQCTLSITKPWLTLNWLMYCIQETMPHLSVKFVLLYFRLY